MATGAGNVVFRSPLVVGAEEDIEAAEKGERCSNERPLKPHRASFQHHVNIRPQGVATVAARRFSALQNVFHGRECAGSPDVGRQQDCVDLKGHHEWAPESRQIGVWGLAE